MYQLAAKFKKKLIVVNLAELLDNPLHVHNSSNTYTLARDGKHFGIDFHQEIAKQFSFQSAIY